MAIAFGATTQGKSGSGSATLTFAHTTSGDQRVLFVGAVAQDAGDSITGVTYNSVAMTKVGSVVSGAGGNYATLWKLHAPATGANDVVITRSGSNAFIWGQAISYTDCNQVSTSDSSDTDGGAGSATSRQCDSTSVANQIWAVAVASADNGSLAASTNSTLRGTIQDGGFGMFDNSGVAPIATGGTAYSMRVTAANGGMGMVMAGFAPNSQSVSLSETVTLTETLTTATGTAVSVSDSVNLHEKLQKSQTGTDWSNTDKSSSDGWVNVDKS